MDWVVISILGGLILFFAVLAGALSLRQSRGTERGSLPGKGDHVIDVNYNTGGGGGTQMTSYTIPRDPQEYAKRFVPKERRK